MTALASIIATATILAVALWTAGGLLLRFLGALTTIAGLLLAASGAPVGLAIAAGGVLAWLAGQHLYAVRHQAFKSPLARRAYGQLLPARLDPTCRWATPITRPPSRPDQPRQRQCQSRSKEPACLTPVGLAGGRAHLAHRQGPATRPRR